MKLKRSLSKREKEIMDILWNSSEPLTASEIIAQNSDLKMPTVQAVMKKLLKEEIVEVSSIVYSRNVLSRSYKPMISADEYVSSQYCNLTKNLSVTNLFVSLLGSTQPTIEEIEEMQKILDKYKNKFEEK